jgi:TPP-dependent pyruvate/acetoin dehydrogenase alpha subunit
MQKSQQVVACFFGDGATSEGAFHEGVNMGAIWNLPVIYVCENNFYGASTGFDKITRMKSVVEKSSGYGIPGQTIYGNDVLAVYEATLQAAEACRKGEGPVLLELLTYRTTGHSRRDPGLYQPKDEKEAWVQRDPIQVLGRGLVLRQDIQESELEQIRSKVTQQLLADIEIARNEPEPTLADLTTDVYA